MTRPTALVIGPMKAGTSWIYQYLLWRGDVCLPAGIKETFYFDRYAARGDAWYARHFAHHDPARHGAILEVAPTLFHCPQAPARVRASLGPVPLIVTLRDPVRRAWSHYMHLRRKGFTRKDLPGAVQDHPEILDASRFDAQIGRWRAALPEAPVTLLHLEDLVADRDVYAQRLCAALALPDRPPPARLDETNAGGVPPSFLLARAARTTADLVRAAGGYGLVNYAKRLGLREAVFGVNGARRIAPAAEDLALLSDRLGAPPPDRS